MTVFDPLGFHPRQVLRPSVSKAPPDRSGSSLGIQKIACNPLDHKRALALNTLMSLSAHSKTPKESRCQQS
jgi:hypothetical protein